MIHSRSDIALIAARHAEDEKNAARHSRNVGRPWECNRCWWNCSECTGGGNLTIEPCNPAYERYYWHRDLATGYIRNRKNANRVLDVYGQPTMDIDRINT